MGVSEARSVYTVAPAAADEVPIGYKRTEVGVIPQDWDVTSVDAEFSVQLGKMLDTEKNVGMPRPFLGNRAVQWGRIDLEGIGEIKLTPSDMQRYRLKAGDLLVCEGGEVGRSAIWNGEMEECYYQKALHRLRPKRSYDVRLMQSVLQRMSSSGYLQNFVTQTSIAHLPKEKFVTVLLPHPKANEQFAIADALFDADALIESLEQLLAKKRQVKQGAMQELLTGKKRLPGFNAEWKASRLGDIGHTYGGLTGKSKRDFGHGPGQYITFMNVMSNVIIDCDAFDSVDVRPNESQNRAIKGDLFFNGSSETPEEVGMCAYLDSDVQDVYLNSFCFGFRARVDAPVDRLYLAYYFRSYQGRELLRSLAQGATRYNLSKTGLLRVEFPLPAIEEQTAIARIVSDMDAELATLETKLTKACQLKQGMMQELLTGRIRLV